MRTGVRLAPVRRTRRPSLSQQRYDDILDCLRTRGHLNGQRPPPERSATVAALEPRAVAPGDIFEFIDPAFVWLDFGMALNGVPFIEPDGYYDLPLRLVSSWTALSTTAPLHRAA